jgi:hypothetical protein
MDGKTVRNMYSDSFWYISKEMQLYTVYLFLENCSTYNNLNQKLDKLQNMQHSKNKAQHIPKDNNSTLEQ